MSATNLCPDCHKSLADCECDTVTVAIPFCPTCDSETAVYCMECSYDFVGCDCVEEGSSWYCMKCDADFEFDIYDLGGLQEPLFDQPPAEPQAGIWQDPADLKWYYDDGTEVKCRCYKPKLVVCHACNVSRASATSRWLPWIDSTFEKASAGQTYSSGYAAAYGYGYGSWHRLGDGCDHKMVEVKINDLTVYASSLNDTRSDNIPDWGLYADWSWTPWWRNEHIAWKDYGLPTSYETAAEQICFAYDVAKSGKRVEIGCIGGHGRTGTILCCMAILEGMTPDEAMKHVESVYCSKVVETWEQQWWLKWFEAHIKGHEAPPKPAPPPKPVAATTTPEPTTTEFDPYAQYCTITEHHEMFKIGATGCKWSTCTSFEFDLQSYLRGKKSYATVSDIADAVLGQKKENQNRK